MFCDNLAINEMNPGMAGFLVAKKRMVELNGGMQQGIVYLLGAGPGDPGLITVRGRELVGMAEVLVYDALSSAEMLNWAPAACERIFVGKRASRHALPQEEINALLVRLGRAGKKVVRLKGGDPYVFGRGGEEADALHEAGIPFEVVPGVTSAIAGPAYAGIPVTHRGYCTQFTVFTGHEGENKKASSLDLRGIAEAQGTKVMLMGMRKLADVCEALIGYGQEPSVPAAAVQWATTGIQRTVTGTVKTLPARVQKAGLGAPAVVVIGDVVKERESLNWFEKLPLFGKRIVVTRTRAQAGELSARLRRLGAEVLEMPVIRIAPPSNRREFAESVVHAHTYDWLVFSSPNGVERFFQAFFAVYRDIRSIGGARIAAIGPGTEAKLREYGLAVDVMPKKFVAEGLVKAFRDAREEIGTIEHSTFLWVRGEEARRVIYDGLNALGAIVDECIAYKTEAETEDVAGAQAAFRERGADIVTFTSSSTAENFFKLGLPWPEGCRAASIGPVTTATLKELGHAPSITAKTHDINGLVEAIVKAAGKYGKRRGRRETPGRADGKYKAGNAV